jgi:MFS family permease
MSEQLLIAADLVAVVVLAFGLYFPRYRRRDIVVALIAINVGVLAIATALSSVEVGLGLGFGLFAVLSIIRLRSEELDQEEVAYYFSAIALGVLGGVELDPSWSGPALMGAIVVALAIADHPWIFGDNRHQTVTLDAAYTNEAELIARLGELLGGSVKKVKVKRVNLVNDTTVVDVRYRLDG